MSPRRRTGRRFLKALLPIVLLLALCIAVAGVLIVYSATHPPSRAYLLTPEKFGQLSSRGLKVTDEKWPNADGTMARGWLLRGTEGAPAIVLLHRYGADRSWLLNLGVTLNETTNFTVLWPDLRGHGQNPLVGSTSFGSREAEDVTAALKYLRTLKSPRGQQLVGDRFGLYGVEMGAYAALLAAAHPPEGTSVSTLVLDSVPAAPDEVLREAVKTHTGLDNEPLQLISRLGARLYFLGHYENKPACAAAAELSGGHVLLLSGEAAGPLRDSTAALAHCFSNQVNLEIRSDLPLTGLNQTYANGEQGEAYDRRVIEFFDRTLRAGI